MTRKQKIAEVSAAIRCFTGLTSHSAKSRRALKTVMKLLKAKLKELQS